MAVRMRGSRWQADVWASGVRYRRDFATREEAQAWHDAKRAEAGRDRAATRPPEAPSADVPRTVGDLLARVYHLHYADGPHARKVWSVVCGLTAALGTVPLARLTLDHLDTWSAAQRRQRLAPSTINGRAAVLSKALRIGAERGWLTQRLRVPRVSGHTERLRYLEPEEEARLLALLRHWGREDAAEVVTVLIDTGLRNSELWGLTAQDVNLRLNRITVRQARHEGGSLVQRTKNGMGRMLPMTARVRAIIERRLAEARSGFLFPHDNAWLRGIWDRAREHLGYGADPHFVPYVCRHTCASRLVQRGVPLLTVKEWLGHKTLTVTLRYAHLSPTMFDDAVKALERAPVGTVG